MEGSTNWFRTWSSASVSLIVCLVALYPFTNVLAAKPPEVSHDGLHLVEGTKLDLVYLRPGADFSIYKRISLLDCAVAFKKNWQREQNQSTSYRVTKKDMDEISAELSKLFDEVMREEMQTNGKLPVVGVSDEDVLVLRPAIVDLDISVPKAADMSASRSRTFSTSAGAMTLIMEFYDGATGEIVARIADRESATNNLRMTWQNSSTNRVEAKRIIRLWAMTLSEGLEQVRNRPVLAAP